LRARRKVQSRHWPNPLVWVTINDAASLGLKISGCMSQTEC
jgi:hypothetical protein